MKGNSFLQSVWLKFVVRFDILGFSIKVSYHYKAGSVPLGGLRR